MQMKSDLQSNTALSIRYNNIPQNTDDRIESRGSPRFPCGQSLQSVCSDRHPTVVKVKRDVDQTIKPRAEIVDHRRSHPHLGNTSEVRECGSRAEFIFEKGGIGQSICLLITRF